MTTLVLTVAASGDDAMVMASYDGTTITWQPASTSLGRGFDNPNTLWHYGAIRFPGASVATPALVTSAELKLRAGGAATGSYFMRVYGIDADDVASFAGYTNQPVPPITSAYFAGTIALGKNSWDLIDVTAAIQEVLDRPGYAGNALGVLLTPGDPATDHAGFSKDDYLPFESWDTSGTNHSSLTIIYEPGEPVDPPTEGAASGAVSFPSSAIGDVPPNDGAAATGAVVYAGSATGNRVRLGSASGAAGYAGTGSGKHSPLATGSGATTFSGSGSGTAPRHGAATGAVALDGGAAGEAKPSGQGTGSVALTASLVVGGSKTGGASSGTVTFARVGSAGQRASRGAATGTTAYSGSASGDVPPNGGAALAGAVSYTSAAAGAKFGKGGGGGSFLLIGVVSSGTRTAIGSGSGGFGYTEIPQTYGRAAGGVAFVGTSGAGSRRSDGLAAGAIEHSGAASGARESKATASGSVTASGSAVGTWPPPSGAAGASTATWSGSGVGQRLVVFVTPTMQEAISGDPLFGRYYLPVGTTVIKKDGHYVDSPYPWLGELQGLTDGVDYFLGGRVYRVSDEIAAALAVDGYNAS